LKIAYIEKIVCIEKLLVLGKNALKFDLNFRNYFALKSYLIKKKIALKKDLIEELPLLKLIL
jgi:hypothetical protein